MRSARVLGKGRVLGSAPPTVTHDALPASSPSEGSAASHSIGSSSVLSSTIAASDLATAALLSSSTSRTASPLSGSQNTVADISAAAAVDGVGIANASSRLLCPICSEEMVTLLQLNRHLDDEHANLEVVQQAEVKNWFQSQVDKARAKLQIPSGGPLAGVLSGRFKGLDVFESNNEGVAVVGNGGQINQGSPGKVTPVTVGVNGPPEQRIRDPEEDVTRAHWQRPQFGDLCADPACGKRLGTSSAGSVNCRKCGRLFCEEHTMYQMKLTRQAQHDAVRGVWCRVCETCYKSREGYGDVRGQEKDLTEAFKIARRPVVDKLNLETSRLEKRLSKLTQLLANPPPEDQTEGRSLLWGLGGGKSQQRSLEQSIISWEEDSTVPKCPFCHQEFSNYSFRRHHCRLCGRVVCGDITTQCSTLVGLNVASEKGSQPVGFDVRMCKDCRHTLFSKDDFNREIQHKPPDQRTYDNMVQFERGIRLLLPKFQRLLVILQDPDKPPTPPQLAEATKVRKRLTDSFLQYESAARRIRDLPTDSPTQIRLQKAVYLQASNFLHLNMFPLRSLPKILKHASPHGAKPGSRPSGGALARITGGVNGESPSSPASTSSAAIESLEAEEKDLREKLVVLEEQKFLVNEMLTDARKKRRFEEMHALSANVDDLSREIDGLRARLSRVEGDFEGLYREMQIGDTASVT